MKILKWVSNNILLVITLFFLVFIPLYPKLPLFDITNTWVYIRIEDLLVAAAVLVFFVQALRKKATLDTPLTVPFIIFWTIGLLSLIYAILFMFPTLSNVYPHVAALHYIRQIEYISVFFIAYSSIKNKQSLTPILIVLLLTFAAVIFYGYGQKGFLVTTWENRFPAFSTMNEEFAKGIPLKISALGRVSSTFAGHYDLAAYLVMMIAIAGSLIFGFKKIWQKILLFMLGAGGLILLFMTASRVSVAVYLLTVAFMLVLQKQKKYIIPIIIASIVLMQFFQGISDRFASTISQVDVVIDARTGKPIGVAKTDESGKTIIEDKDLTGEDLPQGSGFINLPNQSSTTTGELVYKKTRLRDGISTTEIENYQGDFVVRKALAYDVSFTTRFQGGWPRAIAAFKKNVLMGSGYSSIDLASDNNYLRILGETGIIGFAAYFLIYLVFGIYCYRIIPTMEKGIHKSFLIGITAALFGLGLNAILIDVFVASKVAFVTWLLIGISLGVLKLYEKNKIHILHELGIFFQSPPVIIAYFLFAGFMIFSMIFPNFFVGDDFTWLRWAAECQRVGDNPCIGVKEKVIGYFINSDGFFYRPGTKIYFLVMYAVFWLHQAIYHGFSIILHIMATASVFLLTLKLLKNKVFAVLAGVLFLTMSVHFESIFWISVTGHMIASVAILMSTIFYAYWRDTKNYALALLAFILAAVSPLFHEFGVIAPIILVGYDLLYSKGKVITKIKEHYISHLIFLSLIPAYLIIRYISHSHWQGGDYSYNLMKLPVNILGNLIGYVGIVWGSTGFMPAYETLRTTGRENIGFLMLGLIIVAALCAVAYINRKWILSLKEKKTILFGLFFFVITLLPFLGLGNITYRYAYLPSAGLILAVAAIVESLYKSVVPARKIIFVWITVIVVGSYSFQQILELRRINQDWQKAGDITSGVVNDVTAYYESLRIKPVNPVFYFANVPIKKGEAWIFPVGLDDALWFPFMDRNLTVKQIDSVDVSQVTLESSTSARFFEFGETGSVSIIRKEFTK